MVNRNEAVTAPTAPSLPPSDFKWSVSTVGYEVRQVGPIPFITDQASVEHGISPHRRTYKPLEAQALYVQLSDVPTEPEGILEFANRYGLLEIDDWYYQSHENSPQKGSSCEPFAVWVEIIEELRAARRIFEFIQTNQIVKLRECIEIEEVSPDDFDELAKQAKVQVPRNLHATVSMLDPFNQSKRLERVLVLDSKIAMRDPVAHAAGYLARASNHRLREGVAPRVFWEPVESRFQIRMTPTTLLGAVWLQFSLALADNKRVGTCGKCGDPFEVSRKSSRADRQYCSNKCRSKAYRNRKELAAEMGAAGQSPEQIAAILGSDPKTVRTWIRGGSGQT